MFNIEKETINTKYLLLLIALAYTFSIAIRMIWVFQFNGHDPFYWNDQLMINTNDGYIWASSAINELTGQFENNPRVVDMYQYGTVFFTYLAAKILPFSFDSIILYMPAVISSLVVIPIILLARLYNLTLFGFFAALLGSIAWSYYNRTMVGYFDTDMFSAMAPMFILYFLIRTIEYESLHNALMAALAILIYPFLYDSGLSIVYAMGLIYMIYMVIFHRYENFTYQSIILIAVALMGIPWFIKIATIGALFVLLMKRECELKNLMIIAGISVLAFLYTGNVFNIIWAKVAGYAIRGVENEGLKFFQVAQTVREAGQIPFETMANRISGSVPGVFAALAGYILLVIKFRPFILALPLIGIGVFSLLGGLRFTVYAVPVAAMGAIFLFYVISNFSDKKVFRYSIISVLTALILYPNITHIINYKVPTVFTKEEVEILDRLKNVSSPEDYTIAWWDYGYPLWYYSNTNTLIDGGKHNQDNYIVSRILNTSSQLEAVQLSRLAVETYIDSDYKIIANTLFKNHQPDQVNVENYLENLRKNRIDLPEKSVDIFLYLPFRMMNILPTATMFSNLDLNTGEKRERPFFYATQQFKDEGTILFLGNGVALDKRRGVITLGKQEVPLKGFYTTILQPDGSTHVQSQLMHMSGELSLIYMKSYNKFLLVDDFYLNSLYIQMFVFENYDNALFEAVELSPHAKIYRVKI
jgi:undecaprenyl-diphosphooligosaccharide--protein glycosyltransferase